MTTVADISYAEVGTRNPTAPLCEHNTALDVSSPGVDGDDLPFPTSWKQDLQQYLAPTTHFAAQDDVRARALFKIQSGETPTAIEISGLRIRPFYHQVVAVAWMLDRHASTRGGIQADDMGLGKTVTALVLIWANAVIAEMFEIVGEARRATDIASPGILTKDGRHLREAAPAGSTCPSLNDPHWPLQCVCEPGSVSKRVALAHGNALCVVPPTLLNDWLTAASSIFDPQWRGLGAMNTYVAYALPTSHPTVRDNISNLGTVGLTSRRDWPRVDDCEPFPGQERNIIVTTSQSFRTHTLTPARNYRRGRGRAKRVGPDIWVGLVVVDEAHRQCLETSYLFKEVLGDNGLDITTRPIVWFLSGTPHPRGPLDLQPLLHYLSRQWPFDNTRCSAEHETIRAICDSDVLYQSNKAVQKCKVLFCKTKNPDLQMFRGIVRPPLVVFMAILAELVIRRTTQTPLFSHETALAFHAGQRPRPILQLPPLKVIKIHCSMPLGWADRLKEYVKDAKAAVLSRRRALLSGTVPLDDALEKNTALHRRAVFAFPELLDLEEEGHFPSGWNVDVIKAQGMHKRDNPMSPIWQHHRRLAASSPKLAVLYDIIKTMDEEDEAFAGERLQYRARAVASGDTQEEPLEDYLEQLVILTNVPMVAAILAEILRQQLPGREVGLFGSMLNGPERADLIKGFQKVRQYTDDGSYKRVQRNENGDLIYAARSKPTILVGTLATLGEGLTLHRARRVVVFEPQPLLDLQLQGIKRVHRIGATRPCEATILVADYDPMDVSHARENDFDELTAEVLGSIRPADVHAQ